MSLVDISLTVSIALLALLALLVVLTHSAAMGAIEIATAALDRAEQPCECVEDLAAADDAIEEVERVSAARHRSLHDELHSLAEQLHVAPAPPSRGGPKDSPPREPRHMNREGW